MFSSGEVYEYKLYLFWLPIRWEEYAVWYYISLYIAVGPGSLKSYENGKLFSKICFDG